MFLLSNCLRAFSSNLQKIRTTNRERKTLVAAGIEDSTIQNYLAWRRGLLLFVVICTMLSAGLLTYRMLYETSDEPELLRSIESEIEVFLDQELIDYSSPSSVADGGQEGEYEEGTVTAFGEIAEEIGSVAWCALPLASLAAAVFWTRFRLTHRIMLIAFAISFLLPILLALCPWGWFYIEPNDTRLTPAEKRLEAAAYGVAYGIEYVITLLPIVLSLVPGTQRACLRVKTLFPQSVLPGWLLVAASPFYALILLVMFVAINQVVSGPYFFVGMLLLVVAPLIYCVRLDVLTKPLTTPSSFRRLRVVQFLVALTTTCAVAFLLVSIMNIDIQGYRIVGLESESSLIKPLDILEFILETVGKSMFMTVLGADLLMLMNLAAWKNSESFERSEEAVGYGCKMEQMERIASSRTSKNVF